MNVIKDLSIQDFLAVTVSLGVFILVILKYPVPDQIWSAWMVIITFFFSQQPKANLNTTTTLTSTTVPTTEVKL